MARSSSQDRISQFSGMVRSTSLDRMSQLSVDSGDRTLKDTSLHGSAGGDPSGHGWAKGERSMERLIAETVSQVAKKRKLGLSNIWIPDSGRMVTAKVFQKLTTGSSEGLQFFGERCAEMNFKFGEGLPGRVWELGQVEWVPDVTQLTREESSTEC